MVGEKGNGWRSCEIPSVAEGMGHDEGWVQGEVLRRGGGWGEGAEGEGQGQGGKMREVEYGGEQQTEGGTGNGNEGATRWVSKLESDDVANRPAAAADE